MAAADDLIVQQPMPHEGVTGPVLPAAPHDPPAPPAGIQVPVNHPQGAQAHLQQNAVAQNHLAVPGPPILNLGASPLLRSLYGQPLGN